MAASIARLKSAWRLIEGTSNPGLRQGEHIVRRFSGGVLSTWITLGRFVLTDQRLVFLPMRIEPWSRLYLRRRDVELSEIADVRRVPPTVTIWPPFRFNDLWEVVTTDGRVLRFGGGGPNVIHEVSALLPGPPTPT